MELLAVCVVVVLFFWVRAVMKRGAETQARMQEESHYCQRVSEARAYQLMAEFPALYDGEIAQLMRDELVNRGQVSPVWFRWANEETVSRLRRTAIIEAEREKREQKLRG